MRSSSQDAGSDKSSRPDPQPEERRPHKEKRSAARLRVGLVTAKLRADKKVEDELFKSTVVVTSSPPPLDANELHTPSNIQLHEEVFVHYPSSTMNSPESPTAEGHLRSTSAGQGGEVADSGQGHSPTAQQSGRAAGNNTTERSREGPILHEQDHDCCPFTAIRRSEWTLRTVSKVHHTSPFDWSHVLSSFSVKNAFMFYPPPPTYCFFRDEDGAIQVRSQTGKRAPLLDHERVEYVRRKCRLSDKVPDDLVAGALHGIACPNPQDHGGGDGGDEDDSEPSFKLIFIPWENEVQSYYIRSGAVVFGRRVRMGHPLFALACPCPIPCSIIRPHRRMSSHVAIFFHCNGEDIGRPSCLRLLTLANALHMTILVPEYPGYGLFEGSPSEASIKGAMERVVEFLFTSDPSITPSRLILMGHSIGTGVAVHVAKFVKRIFLKLHDSPDLNYQIPYACPMSRYQSTPAEYTAAVRCPPNSYVAPFSAVPTASPTARIPPPHPPGVKPLPVFTPPNAPLTSDPTSADSGGNVQPVTDARADAADGGTGLGSTPTPVHAPYGKSGSHAPHSGKTKTMPSVICPHYALGGVILLAPFASVRCVEKWTTLKSHGFSVEELERRHLSVPEDVLVPAPEDWAEDAHELRDTGADPPNMDFLRPSPFLFDVARYISFNRFPTIDVVSELQDEVGFFTHTPLLLVHGAQDVLIPGINSVAIASRLRQSRGGRTAKVYLGFLHDEGHNNLHCSHLIRRFYKDVILLPHLRAQQELREELEETLRNGLGNSNGAGNADPPAELATTSNKTTTAATTSDVAEAGRSTEPRAFEAASQHTARLRSPTTDTNHTTEPFGEEQPELPTSESTTKHPCSACDDPAATTGATAAETGKTAAAVVTSPSIGPYLYFIEPAYAEEGATWSGGNFTGPVRIRLLHPPPHRHFMTEFSPQTSNVQQGAARDANVFVTRPVDLTHGHEEHHHRHHHGKHPSDDACVPAVQLQPVSPQSHARHAGQHGSMLPGGMQTCRVSEEFEDSLRDTLHRTQPPNVRFAPAATMLHIALFHHLDHYDVGSIAVASVTKHSIDAAAALALWRRYRFYLFVFRCLIALFYFSAGFFFISLAICHGVLTHPSKLRPYLPAGASTKPYHLDARVIVWGVLDGLGYLLLGCGRFFHSRLGIGNLSKYMHTPTNVIVVYATCRITAYVVCSAAGVFMAMILALTPPDRGGVDWERWSNLPYSRRVWIAYLPRWTMVTSASIHMFFLLGIFLKNH